MVSEVNRDGLIVRKIKDGTVIDHITAGRALTVLRILGIKGNEGVRVSLLMYTDSSVMGKKDVVKIEGRELKGNEVDLISLISPNATINIIRNYEVVEKRKLSRPKQIRELLKCNNPSCISNNDPEAFTDFRVDKGEKLVLRCEYCGSTMYEDDVLQQIVGE